MNDLIPYSEVQIEGYPNYTVTSDGRVWSKNYGGKWLRQCLRKGYPFVDLCRDNKCTMFSVHRLVAVAFIPNPNSLPQINHKNSVKTDNRVENLEWCTASHNKQHSWDVGTTYTTERKREASRRNIVIAEAARQARRAQCQTP